MDEPVSSDRHSPDDPGTADRSAPGIGDSVALNRRYWDGRAAEWVADGERAWAADEPYWGIWRVPESEVGVLAEVTAGCDAVELGCGTGYVSGWMVRRGARVTGIDPSGAQLATARRLAAAHGVDIRWVQAAGEALPLADRSFDVAVTEYGAALWADPLRWVPEAARVLRPGGTLVVWSSTALMAACERPDGSGPDRWLHRPMFGMHRRSWADLTVDPGGVEHHLSHGDWISLVRSCGFEILGLTEVRAPDGPPGDAPFGVPRWWARRWPAEELWRLRRP